ncbi:MAG: hypothetical protein GY827_03605 [Cytophagales bacterium]|nr:hypothetical protein [Cytophagales bacterium]
MKILDTNGTSTKIFNTDTSLTTNLKKKIIQITTPLCKELDKSYSVLNKEKLVIHYEIMANNLLEIEVSNNEILYQKNNEPLKSTTITPELWIALKSNCMCDSTYGLNTIFDITLNQHEQKNIYRISNNLTNDYSSCFKVLTDTDKLNDVLSTIEKIK